MAASLLPDWVRSHHTLALISLVATTAVWGATFVVVHDAVAQMQVFPFLFWRFALAATALAIMRPQAITALSADARKHGLVLGLMLGGGYVLQTYGLLHTSATVSGFITGMFLVFTPIIARVIFGDPIASRVWLAVTLACFGLLLIGTHGLAFGLGEMLTLGCAALFAGQIVGLARWSTVADAYGLTALMLSVVAVMSFVAALLTDGLQTPPNTSVWVAIAFLALIATALAFLAQAWAQTHMSAPKAAIVLTLEPLFAGFFGVWVGGDALTARILGGGFCIVAAMFLVEFGPTIRREGGA